MHWLIPKNNCNAAPKIAVALLLFCFIEWLRWIHLDHSSIHPIVIVGMSNGEMPWQITDIARHDPIANNVCNKAVLLIACGGRDQCLLSETDLAPRNKLGAAHFVCVACLAIFNSLHPNDVNLCPHQMLSNECMINNWMWDHGNTSLGGSSDNIVLLGAHHVSHPGSDGRSTPWHNLVPARILSPAVGTGELLPSLIGGGAVPTLPCNLT